MGVSSRANPSRGLPALIALASVLSVLSMVAHLLLLVALVPPRTPADARGGGPRPPRATSRPTESAAASSNPGSAAGIPGDPPTGLPIPTSSAQLPEPAVPAFDDHCLRNDNPPTGAKLPVGDPFGDTVEALGEGAELQRVYAVRDGALVAIDHAGAPRPCDEQVWQLLSLTAPTQVRYVAEFLIFDADPNPDKDQFVIEGEATPQRITRTTVDDSHWRISIAPNGLDRADLGWLIAHELAHVISLNDSQTTPTQAPVCEYLDVGTGCLLPVALLSRYLHATWEDGLYDEWVTADRQAEGDPTSTAYKDFQRRHRDAFVTSYAATHPVEDFAESFAMWCSVETRSRAVSRLPRTAPTDSGHKVDWFAAQTHDLVPELDPGCAMLRKFASS